MMGVAELTEGGEEAAARNTARAAAVQSPARTRGRGKGRGACGALRREDEKKGKGVWRCQTTPFKRCGKK
jgi:hypothetical protein